MPRKPKRSTQKNTADRMFSLYIRARDGMCVECGTTEGLQCAHGFSRGYLATRWDERNAWALCAGHHVFYTHRPLEWDEWMRKRMGERLYVEVRMLALSTATGQKNHPDYDDIIADLQSKIREQEEAA